MDFSSLTMKIRRLQRHLEGKVFSCQRKWVNARVFNQFFLIYLTVHARCIHQLELASARKTFLLCITLTPRAAQAQACKQLSDSVR
jgi:hypothetical protein